MLYGPKPQSFPHSTQRQKAFHENTSHEEAARLITTQQLGWITNFIWGIADDVLRDVYVRGKYRDVILPMVVIRRLDAVLEPTQAAVLAMKKNLDAAGVANQDAALRQAAGQAFFNSSPYSLRDLRSRAKVQQLKADFEAYLDGFSPNVQEILDKFKFRNQIQTLVDADVLGSLIEKFLEHSINLSPTPVHDADGRVRLPALDNHAMGTLFEELIRRFNEENNEEAGEHFTPRDVVKLLAELIFRPIADRILDGTYTVYDSACGTGGMLTVSEDRLKQIAVSHGKKVSVHLFGQEVQPETYAITKADLLLKGEGEEAENFIYGSTLSADGFPASEFDFMVSNPPYGKSWKSDLEKMGGKDGIRDPRFVIDHAGIPDFSLLTRSSDGQLLFLVNMLAKMKRDTPLGSRIAEVHNGSALFTGDAGQGESNIRRWILENDWLEAIVALPLNIFYNTGIATYIWVLTNRKPAHRLGKVQLIDATSWFQPLRKNLGKKNCEMGDTHLQKVMAAFQEFTETEQSKIFPNAAFGYWKVTVERPLRLRARLAKPAIAALRFASGDPALRKALWDQFGQALYDDFAAVRPDMETWLIGDTTGATEAEDDEDSPEARSASKARAPENKRRKLLDRATWDRDRTLMEAARALAHTLGEDQFDDYNDFLAQVEHATKKGFSSVPPNGRAKTVGAPLAAPSSPSLFDSDSPSDSASPLPPPSLTGKGAGGLGSLSPADKKLLCRAMSWRDDDAPPVRRKVHAKATPADPLHGLYEAVVGGKACVVEYEPDSDLRDTENVPLLEEGGIEAFFRREVLPHVPDAWIVPEKTQVGYEISFTRYFYKPKEMRTLNEIRRDIEGLEKETVGLLDEVLLGAAGAP